MLEIIEAYFCENVKNTEPRTNSPLFLKEKKRVRVIL